jgi:hypothetical protein
MTSIALIIVSLGIFCLMRTRKWALITVSCHFIEYISLYVSCKKIVTFIWLCICMNLWLVRVNRLPWILIKASLLQKHLRYDMILYDNLKICKLIWVKCIPSCVWGDLRFQVDITGAEMAVEWTNDAGAGVGMGDPRPFRCERPPARRGRARVRVGEAAELLGEEGDPGKVQKWMQHTDSAVCWRAAACPASRFRFRRAAAAA